MESVINSLSAEVREAKARAMIVLDPVWNRRLVAEGHPVTTLALVMEELDAAIVRIEQSGDAQFLDLVGQLLRELDPQFSAYYSLHADRMAGGGAKLVLNAMEFLVAVSTYQAGWARRFAVYYDLNFSATVPEGVDALLEKRQRCLAAAQDLLYIRQHAWLDFHLDPAITVAIHVYFECHHPLVAQTRATFTSKERAERGKPPPLKLPVVSHI